MMLVFFAKSKGGCAVKFRELTEDDVVLVSALGEDSTPYYAARMSFDAKDIDESRQETFLSRLIDKGHLVPFEHCVLTFEISAPIFVFRQLFRYRTAAISEKSMRYSDKLGMFYVPSVENQDLSLVWKENYVDSVLQSVDTYYRMIDSGIPKELARTVLPVSMYSHAYFTVNLRNLFHLLDQRLDLHAQSEIRFVAVQMFKRARERFPVIMECYAKLNLDDIIEK